MKKARSFEEVVKANKSRFIKVAQHLEISKQPRTKPRSHAKSMGLSIATTQAVRKAFQSGQLVKKEPKGFLLK